MPDALSKTVPIWCCVLNRALFPDDLECHELYTPGQVVSSSEHAQMCSRIPQFIESLKELGIDCHALRRKISKPLRPIWVTPESDLESMELSSSDFHPIICCTASRRVSGTEVAEGGYIQGAGDDTENWGMFDFSTCPRWKLCLPFKCLNDHHQILRSNHCHLKN